MSIFDPFDINQLNSSFMNDDTEFFPLLTTEDEEVMNSEEMPEVLSILPLRNTVLFPGVVIPITVGRDKSIKLIREAYKGNKIIGVVAQTDVSIEDPVFEDLNRVGTVAYIIKMLQMPDGNTTVIIQGKKRFNLEEQIQSEPYFKAKISPFAETPLVKKDKEFTALISSLRELSNQIIQLSPNIPSEASFALKNIESSSFLINFICSNMNADVSEKQRMLEVADLKQRAQLVLEHLTRELQMLELKNQIQSKVFPPSAVKDHPGRAGRRQP
jgi:ATP-dependent Lon protease